MKTNAKALSAQYDYKPNTYKEAYFLSHVISVSYITPHMIRLIVQLQGDADLTPSGHPDEWVHLFFKKDENERVYLPTMIKNGKWCFAENGKCESYKKSPHRPYTIRYWNAALKQMTIDIVVHKGGVAATFAQNAKIGDEVGLCNPGGRFWLPKGAEWLLMLVDMTGLPAMSRILEELPKNFKAIIHVEVPSIEDCQKIETKANAEIIWHYNQEMTAKANSKTQLINIAKSIKSLPKGMGYIYIAGEALAVKESRHYFREYLGFDKKNINAIGYWIKGQART